MKGDFTRFTFNRTKHYSCVRMQQGRVQMDADWNEQLDIAAYRVETETLDVIGECGAPKHDAGFGLTPLAGGNFEIGKGRLYADGILCENDATLAFTAQQDCPAQQPIGLSGRYLVYLDVWRRHLTALDDPLVRETALGGPDTATRTKTIWQVKTVRVGDLGAPVDCASEPPDWTKIIAPSTGRLRARTKPGPADDQPCIIQPGSGYRRLENQLYRVEIHRGGAANDPDPAKIATFKWSRDNGSIAANVAIINPTSVVLSGAPRDPTIGFAPGQWIELLDDRNELLGDPGTLVRVTQVDGLTLEVDAAGAIGPFNAATFTRNPKVHRWDSVEMIDATIPVANDGYLPLEDGVEVKFEAGTYRTGDYWTIPARTNLGDVEWPQDNSVTPGVPAALLAQGIDHHFCRLAVIEFNGTTITVIEDCRHLFPPLTELEDCCNCCTVTVGTVATADFASIQAAVDSLPSTGGQVCILPGDYTENILVAGRRDIRISGCGRRTRITAAPPVDGALPAAVFHIRDSQGVRIESLAIIAHDQAPGVLLDQGAAVILRETNTAERFPLRDIELIELAVRAVFRSAIEARGVDDLSIRECLINMADAAGGWPGIFLIGDDGLIERNTIRGLIDLRRGATGLKIPGSRGVSGIQLGGGCDRVRVIDNLIQSASGQGITLGSLKLVNEDGVEVDDPIVKPIPPDDDGCDPCRPATGIILVRVLRPDGTVARVQSAGPLTDIHVERNRILDMGLDGIGVIGFFDLREADEFISVRKLTVIANEVRRCLWRDLQLIPDAMLDSMGYGGIALADVENFTGYDNVIEDNGARNPAPICGVFVLHAEGVDLCRNQILNNGRRAVARQDNDLSGRRGGINIVFAVAPVLASDPVANLTVSVVRVNFPEPTGRPAVRILENIVSAPIGQALLMSALGPVSVLGNQLTSSGVARGARAALLRPATVGILNLGLSNELYFQLFLFALLHRQPQGALPGLDDARVGSLLANGNVLFADNQCSLDLLEPGSAAAYLSISILSLDDVGFQDNQCDCNLGVGEDFVLSQAFLAGLSVRVTGNRFKEGILNAPFSAITFGWLNTTAHNQATHCLFVQGPPALMINGPNTILIGAFFQRFCGDTMAATLANFAKLIKG